MSNSYESYITLGEFSYRDYHIELVYGEETSQAISIDGVIDYKNNNIRFWEIKNRETDEFLETENEQECIDFVNSFVFLFNA